MLNESLFSILRIPIFDNTLKNNTGFLNLMTGIKSFHRWDILKLFTNVFF